MGGTFVRALLLAVLLLPLASAGNEAEPEIVDNRDVRDTAADLLAAWVVAEDEGLRFFVKVADGSRPEAFPDYLYGIAFEVQGRSVDAIVGYDGGGNLLAYLGPDSGPNWRRGGFERVANDVVREPRAELGQPSVFSGLVPWGALPGFEEGIVLEGLVAFTTRYDRAAGLWPGAIDRASTLEPFTAEVGGLDEDMQFAAVALACALGGALLGALPLARRRPRAPPAPAPPPVAVPVRTTFRLRPHEGDAMEPPRVR